MAKMICTPAGDWGNEVFFGGLELPNEMQWKFSSKGK